MDFIKSIFDVILSFKSYVMLPVLMLILSTIIRLNLKTALRACVTLGIGFIGIFVIFDHFVSKIGPVLKIIIERTGITLNVLDVGWPPLAGITWSFKFVPLLIIIIFAVNIVMLVFKLTEVVNIDIWNFWHFIFTAQLTYAFTGSFLLAAGSAVFVTILCIKLADWSVKDIEEASGIKGVSITTLSGLAYYPFTIFMDKIFDKIPGLNKVKADPENMKIKLGLLGEPMFLGIIMGIVLGVFANYSINNLLDLSFNIAAVIFILPRMSAILGEGLIPISEGMKSYLIKKFPGMKNASIGLDLAILVGNPAVIVSGIILMPVVLLFAFILPGIRFIPLGDLPNMIGAVAMIAVATRGNVIRTVLASIPIIIGKLYVASNMAETYTKLAADNGYKVSGYDGAITSFLDGGNLFRYWSVELFSGKLWAILIIPIAAFLMYMTWCSAKTKEVK
jgi:galactitol PTS system EIIC component